MQEDCRCYNIARTTTTPSKLRLVNLVTIAFAISSLFLALGSVEVAATPILDELISARCHAKCLWDFETAALASGTHQKRQLKHSLMQLCKSNASCNSCGRPCREPFDSLLSCYGRGCQDAVSQPDCYRSCQFMRNITTAKPGSCGRNLLLQNDAGSIAYAAECIIGCSRDGDCTDSQKCCHNGCSRSCMETDFSTTGSALLPLPTDVSVSERKRGRSVTIRWVMSQLRPEHEATFTNLYVVQWKWGVRPEEPYMTKWQTISVRNKIYAILKHLLAPGMFYRFRVGAVNANGSLGFSKDSGSFRLTKSPQAPGKPKNLHLGKSIINVNRLFSQEIRWLPPEFNLPIMTYQISWNPGMSPLTDSTTSPDKLLSAKTLKLISKHPSSDLLSTNIDYDEDQQSLLAYDTMMRQKTVSGNELSCMVDELEANTDYVVSVHATVELGSEKLIGHKAFLQFRTPDPEASEMQQYEVKSSDNGIIDLSNKNRRIPQEPVKIYDLVVDEIKYENHQLLSVARWQYKGIADPGYKFLVTWTPIVCSRNYSAAALSDMTVLTETTFVELGTLLFDCSYLLTVDYVHVNTTSISQPESTKAISFEFKTMPCVDGRSVDSTPATASDSVTARGLPNCNSHDSLPVVPPKSISCQTGLAAPNAQNSALPLTAYAVCRWTRPSRSTGKMPLNVAGYRALLQSAVLPESGWQSGVITKIISGGITEVRFDSLQLNSQYVFAIQIIAHSGMGPAIEYKFNTPVGLSEDSTEEGIAVNFAASEDLISRPVAKSSAKQLKAVPALLLILSFCGIKYVL